MSISNKLHIIHRVNQIVSDLKIKYAQQANAALELNKLTKSLDHLEKYLRNLDQLKPDYSTNEINSYVEAINVHLDILSTELENKDYVRLKNGMKVLKTVLKFHPTKYNFFTFIAAWFLEWMYFI